MYTRAKHDRSGLRLLSVLLALTLWNIGTLSAQRATDANAWLLTPTQAGELKLGATADEVYRTFSREKTKLVDLQREGMFTPALAIHLPPGSYGQSLVALIESTRCGDRVSRALIHDRRFRTREGIGVGSTVAEVRRAYNVNISNEEGQHLISRDPQMLFNSRDDLLKPETVIDEIYIHIAPPPPNTPCVMP